MKLRLLMALSLLHVTELHQHIKNSALQLRVSFHISSSILFPSNCLVDQAAKFQISKLLEK